MTETIAPAPKSPRHIQDRVDLILAKVGAGPEAG